ncbi:MAG: Uncharacterised protein [Crocinitomicaceae bacterium]|nr:MAG: Uncharacterised protein [Crocinitomicaceae bacterium]
MGLKKTIVFIFFFPILFFGQQVNFLEIYKNLELFKAEKINSNRVRELVNNILLSEIESGYFTCNVDSINLKNQKLKIYLQTGNLISLNSVKVNLPNSLSLKLREDFISDKTYFNANDFSEKIKKWIILMNNNGFPFAEFEFEKSEIINSKINLICNLISGPLVKIDSIINPEITKKELQLVYKFTDIRNGDLFELNKIYKISENIKNTGFIEEIRPPAYEFIDNKASIYTYFKPQSKNSINGLVGIQPGENETVQFTGNVALNFQNALSYGEVLKFNWRRMFNSSQNLIAELSYPFLFNTNFEVQGGLDMIKKDSSFFNFNSKLIINYKSNSNFSNGFLFTNNNSTNLLEDDYSSTSVNSFGFVTNFKKLDNPFNPRKGFKIKSEIAYGWKETYAIDTVANNILKSPNFNGNLSFSSYLSLLKRTTFKIKLSGSTIQNNILYENELTRIGGYKTIRGFDEESIWVSSFVLGNFEFRYLIDEKSNVFLFSDFAWTESKTNNFLMEDYFQSFGFGTNISMPNGLLTLIYGLGRKIDNPFLIRTGKIHLGFTSYF